MENKLAAFQERKKNSEKKVKIGGGLLILAVLVFVLIPQIVAVAAIIGIVGIVLIIIGFAKFSTLSNEFKVKVMKDLIEDFIDNGVFDPDRGLNMAQVYSTEFLNRADRSHTEDFISGTMDGVDFVSSDVKLEERHVRQTKNGTQTYYVTYFLGRVFLFDFNKQFEGYLQVLEEGKPTVNRKYKKVKLESIDFNKKFKTYSSNEHSAFYVLTPHFMEALMKFEQQNRGKVNFSFIDKTLYIGINNMRDTFELKMFRALDENTINEFKKELLVIKEVIDELKLNNNIFMKE